ncbi:MAG: amidohydrolase family protein [Planctomycetota bacterium]|nr:amidohydrolase family protein [Planctomycetota bacterium]
MNDLIDVSVWSGHWPFRAVKRREPKELKAFLQGKGVRQAWISSAEAVLYPDPMQGNEPLLEAVGGDEFFLPVPILDVSLPLWRKDAEECVRRFKVKAFKLTPNYHQTPLNDRKVDEFCAFAAEKKLAVCIQLRMMEERTHHPLMKIPPVQLGDLAKLASQHPTVKFLACAAFCRDLPKLREASNVFVEHSLVESPFTLKVALDAVGPERLVFGSHSPFIYYEANLAKLNADPVDVKPEALRAIRHGNAARILGA